MVRSPRASTKIADTGVRAPGTRTQPTHSTPSRCRLSMRRSPTASSPSGAAKYAVLSSRARASAAWAALAPPMGLNALAGTLVCGRGNAMTGKTSLRTAIPAQRMLAMSEKALVGVETGADDVMGDRERMGRREAIGVLAQHHGGNFVAREPAGVLQLGTIDLELRRQGLRMTADHQRHRKGPWLRREIGDAATYNAGFLQGFPPHRIFDGFARLDESRKARPHALGKAGLPAEEAPFAIDRQHDDDRIGAGKMLGAAGRAITPPTGLHDARRRAAVRTEAVPPVPAEQGLRLRERRQGLGRHQGASRKGAQVGDREIASVFLGLAGIPIVSHPEARPLPRAPC